MAKKLQVTIDGKEYVSQEALKASQSINDMAKNTDAKSKAMVVAASTVKIAFAAVAAAVGGLAVLTAKAIKEAADMQTVSTSFEVLIGDVDKAKRTIADLRSFAARTPLEFKDISTAAQNLMAFGSEADEVKDQLSMLGDIAMGQADKLESIVRAYGKIQAKGKASMEELNMVTEAGVPVLQALADMYGTTTTKVLEMVSAGKVGFSDVDQAFKDMTSSGGQFYGMMDEQSKTLNGMVSTLKDNLTLLLTKLGEAVLPTATKLLGDALTKLDEFIASDQLDQLLLNITIFAEQTYAVFSHIGSLVSALYTDIRRYLELLFSPNVTSLVAKYGEAIVNNLINYWNTILGGSDYLWKLLGITPTAKISNVDFTKDDESVSEFKSALDGLTLDLEAIRKARTAAWPKKAPINPPVENSRSFSTRSSNPTPSYTGSLGLSIPAFSGINAPFGIASAVSPALPLTGGSGGGGFGQMLKDQLGEVFGGSGLDDLIKAPLGAFTDLAGSVIPLIGSFSSIQALLNPLQTILVAAMDVLGPVINDVLAPLVGILKVVGQLIGGMLTPVIQLLVPVIKLVADVFIWLYNKVLLPAGNGLITVFNLVYNGIVGVMNGIAIAVNFLLGWMGVHMNTTEYRPLNAGHLAEIDYGTLVEQGGANGASYAGGGTGSSTSVQSLNITIHQHFEGNVIGDGGLEAVGQFTVHALQAYAGVGGNVQVIIGGAA